jgi:hypothetical protein
MFLRRHRRMFEGETYDYWTLVRTCARPKARQQVVATLGKEPGADRRARRGWDQIAAMLEGRDCFVQGTLGKALPAISERFIWRCLCEARGLAMEASRPFLHRAAVRTPSSSTESAVRRSRQWSVPI